jgi:hypothetical protein
LGLSRTLSTGHTWPHSSRPGGFGSSGLRSVEAALAGNERMAKGADMRAIAKGRARPQGHRAHQLRRGVTHRDLSLALDGEPAIGPLAGTHRVKA